MSLSPIEQASQAQTALAEAIRRGDADAIVTASANFERLILAAGASTGATDIRPVARLRSDIQGTRQTLNLLRDAAQRRAGKVAELRGQPLAATYRQRPAA